jgi:hypothetical protein
MHSLLTRMSFVLHVSVTSTLNSHIHTLSSNVMTVIVIIISLSPLYKFELRRFHGGVFEDSILLGYDTVSLSNQFPTSRSGLMFKGLERIPDTRSPGD